MITTAALVTFLGFFCLYHTSRKAQLFRSLQLEVWLQDHPKNAKWMGTGLLMAGLVLAIIDSGLGSGSFTFFILLMAAGSLVVIVAPLKFINYKTLTVVFVLSLILELL